MLIKHKKTKEFRTKLSIELITEIDKVKQLVAEAGYELDIDSSIEKHLHQELAKVKKQLTTETKSSQGN